MVARGAGGAGVVPPRHGWVLPAVAWWQQGGGHGIGRTEGGEETTNKRQTPRMAARGAGGVGVMPPRHGWVLPAVAWWQQGGGHGIGRTEGGEETTNKRQTSRMGARGASIFNIMRIIWL